METSKGDYYMKPGVAERRTIRKDRTEKPKTNITEQKHKDVIEDFSEFNPQLEIAHG